jgi:hypothetical protein
MLFHKSNTNSGKTYMMINLYDDKMVNLSKCNNYKLITYKNFMTKGSIYQKKNVTLIGLVEWLKW